MIKVENGRIKLEGSVPVLMTDLSVIIMGLNDCISEEDNKEIAKQMINGAVKAGFMTDEEISKEIVATKDGLLKDIKKLLDDDLGSEDAAED